IRRKNLPNGTFTEEVYVPVYYGGGTDPERAQKIEVAPGSNNSIEFSFAGARVTSFHIRGHVVNGVTRQPIGAGQVRLYPRSWTATAVVPYSKVDKNGNFDIGGVSPGSYALFAASSTTDPNAPSPNVLQGLQPAQLTQLIAQGLNISGSIPIGTRVPVEMSNQNLEDVVLTLLPGGTLSREFVFEGSLATSVTPQQKPLFRANLTRQPELPGASLGGASSAGLAANAPDTSFRIQSIFPGDFRVMVPPLISGFSWTTPSSLPDPL